MLRSAGGWPIDACRNDVVANGGALGDVANNFTLVDQNDEQVTLHDFCGKVVLIEAASFS